MTATAVLLLVFNAVFFSSILASNQVYVVTPDQSCPPDHECHNLSHYVAQSTVYFTSNTTLIFLSGEHYLDRQETVVITGVDNLILEGQGDWVPGPEETVMQSTAIINCTRERGGFSFINSLSVTMQGVTLVNCGTDSPFQIPIQGVMNKSAIFLMNIQSFKFYQNSIQNNVGHGLQVWQCRHVEILNSSFFGSNQKKHDNESLTPGCYYGDGGGTGFYSTKSNIDNYLTISDSNFTKCCSWSTKGGGITLINTGNITITNLIFRMNRAIRGGSGLAAVLPVFTDGSNLLNITKSLFAEGEG